MSFSRLSTVIIMLLAMSDTPAHELLENRATLVLRDNNHISATFYISYPEALYRTLAPNLTYQEFLVQYAALSPSDFQKLLLQAQQEWQSAIKLRNSATTELTPVQWQWPAAEQVQNSIRETVIQAMVNVQPHIEPLDIHAEFTQKQAIKSISIEFPKAFDRVMVVSYMPTQRWVETGKKSAAISF